MSEAPTALPLPSHGALRTRDAEATSLDLVSLCGRLVELSSWGNAVPLTFACSLVLEAQLAGEPVAWVAAGESFFYPPDFVRSGVDLEALPVVHVTDARTAARAADKLLRCGAFGLVVVDLIDLDAKAAVVPAPLQSRLLALASKHMAAVLFLTRKKLDAPSLGSLVSLRAQATRKRTPEGRYACDVEIVKDKRRGPGRSSMEVHHGPAGLH
jgi:recombination protein RecA